MKGPAPSKGSPRVSKSPAGGQLDKKAHLGLAILLSLGLFFLASSTAFAAPENAPNVDPVPENQLHEYSLILFGNSTVTNVRIFLKREVPKPQVSIKPLGSKPPAKVETPASARSFFEISTNLEENYEIVHTTIRFKVSKSWMSNHGILENSIRLMRLNDDWHPLPTKKVEETETYIYFESETPGFSMFALSAEGNPPQNFPYLIFAGVAIGTVGAGGSLFYWFKNRRPEPSISLESLKRKVLGKEEEVKEGLGEETSGLELKPKAAREKTRRDRADLVEELREATKEKD